MMKKMTIELDRKQQIAVADKPLLLGGKVTYIPITEFEQIIGQLYLDKIDATQCLITPSAILNNITGDLTLKQLIEKLEAMLTDPEDNLVLCKIDDSVGYGVFARYDIPKDTVLCFYSGTLRKTMQVNKADDQAISYYGSDVSFSTQCHRGISSFFQHFPSELKMTNAKLFSHILSSMGQVVSESDLKINDELYSIEFNDKKIALSLATANIRSEYISYKGIPVVLFITDKTIKAGEQLGFNYGKDYWLSRGLVPEYFDKQGAIIPATAYKRTYYQLRFLDGTYTGELSPLVQQLISGKEYVELVDDNHQQRKIKASIIERELRRVKGITITQSQPNCSMMFYPTEINNLVKKYRLLDGSQSSLEKGLRNAAANNELADLKQFISLVKNINAKDTNPNVQRTALHWAAVKEHVECCLLLLESGAKDNIPDAAGETANVHLTRTSVIMTQR